MKKLFILLVIIILLTVGTFNVIAKSKGNFENINKYEKLCEKNIEKFCDLLQNNNTNSSMYNIVEFDNLTK